jgi:hypothetical protein
MVFKSASTVRAIVIEQFGQLRLFDLRAADSRRSTSRSRRHLGAAIEIYPVAALANAHLPTGAQALFRGAGEVLTVPAEKGRYPELASTPGVMEHDRRGRLTASGCLLPPHTGE